MKLHLSTGLLRMPHSMTDLKPFMRYKGLTESKFLPLLHDEAFHRLHDRFTVLNNNTPLTDNRASSKKMKRQTKMVSIIKNSLGDQEKLETFNSVINTAFTLTQKKRFYISDYGYENVREVILGEQDELRRGPELGQVLLREYHKVVEEESNKEIQQTQGRR